jgi:hypothetical protein
VTDKTSGAGPSEFQAGAAFLRVRGADLRRAMTSQRARHVWTGAVALAVTGGVLVSASASVPVPGTATSASASGATSTAASTAPSGGTSLDGLPAAARIPGQAGQAALTGTDGVTISQVLAVLDRAERRLWRSPSLNPHIAQAAAELGMLYTTYQAQQVALDGADEAQNQVTFDEVAVAAMRLANLLDPTSPTALIATLPDAESSLRRSLQETVAAYGDSTAGYANGRIPADVLCPLPFAPGHMLRCDAAERLTALSAEFEKEFGYPIPLTDSYRPYALQVAVKGTKPHLAAIPGTSNHGWGLAIDLDDPIAGGSSPEYVWLRLHAPDYGWDNPSWARLGGAKPEPWHFEFFAAGSIPNRAIDPSDVGTWAPHAPAVSDGEGRPVVVPASAHAPGKANAPSGGSGRPAGADHAGGGADADGGAPAADDGSSPKPSDPTPANPEPDAPAEPAPSKPAPSDPPTEDPDAPADTGVVGALVDDAVELVDGTVNGVVGGLVGGLLGTD